MVRFPNTINTAFLRICIAVAALLLSSAQAADIRILIDVSQSMLQHDPENKRQAVISELIDQIPEGDKAAIWTFGRYVNLLVPHQVVTDEWRDQAKAEVAKLGAPAVRSNIGAALNEAAYDFDFTNFTADVETILITDGAVDIAPNAGVNGVAQLHLEKQLIPRYQSAQAKINTLALAVAENNDLLKALSTNTGGRYASIDDAQSLFDQLFDKTDLMASGPDDVMADPEVASTDTTMAEMDGVVMELVVEEGPALTPVVDPEEAFGAPVNAMAGQLDSKVFNVAPGTEQLTLVVRHFANAASLTSPSGQQTSALAPANQYWHVTAGMTEVTVIAPEAGQWKLDAEKFISAEAYSDIALEWTEPLEDRVAQASTIAIAASLMDSEGRSVLANIGQLMEVNLYVDNVEVPINVTPQAIEADLMTREGQTSHQLTLNIAAETFSRTISRELSLLKPYVSELLTLSDAYEWRLYPSRSLDIYSIQAQASFDSNDQVQTHDFIQHEAGYWYWRLPFDMPAGQYDVTLSGDLVLSDSIRALVPEQNRLQVPPKSLMRAPEPNMAMPTTSATTDMNDSSMIEQADTMIDDMASENMAPSVDDMIEPQVSEDVVSEDLVSEDLVSEDFVKEPIIEFEELTADIVVSDGALDPLMSEEDALDPLDQPANSAPIPWTTYLLLSSVGVISLIVAYIGYRWFESRRKTKAVESDMLVGDDELAMVDDPEAFTSGLDLAGDDDLSSDDLDMSSDEDSILDDDGGIDLASDDDLDIAMDSDDFGNDDVPTLGEESLLDESLLESEVDGSDGELFDISDVDGDFDDIDLDVDDPFAESEQEQPANA
ncbi:VWA domain-containing protein [Reinekea thalattae]|nr:vWA domain-containing protein [Reinekea thalattae]